MTPPKLTTGYQSAGMTDAGESEVDDYRMVAGLLRGDERAFRHLYEQHTPRIRMLVIRMLGRDGSDVDDTVQEIWIGACHGLSQFRWESSLSTWLHTIAVRRCLNRVRQRSRHQTVELSAAIQGRVEHPERRLALERAIASLPDRQRLVVVMHDIEGYSHSEIAVQLKIAIGTARSDLSRARGRLRLILEGG